MEIFEPFRAIGYIPSSVPFSVQRLGTETLQQIYNCAKPNLVLVGPQLPKKIRYRDYTFSAYGNLIAVFKRSQQVATWSAHNSKVILLLQFGEYILSVDVHGNLYTWAFNGIEQNLTHPDTYLNKAVSGSEEGSLQLWIVSSKKKLYDFRRWQLPIHCYVSSAALDVVLMSSSTDNSIKMWIFDTSNGEPRLLRFCSAPPLCIRFYANGMDILSARQDRASRLFSDVQDQQCWELSQRHVPKSAKKLKMKMRFLDMQKDVFQDDGASLHGTTVVVLRYKEGYIVAADSRGSNEKTIMDRRAQNEHPIPNLRIRDHWEKQFGINAQIMCVLVGDAKKGILMRNEMKEQCKQMDDVSLVLKFVEEYLKTHPSKIPYGVVILGNGSKIHVAYVMEDKKDKGEEDKDEENVKYTVETQESIDFLCIGSGKPFAKKSLTDEVNRKGDFSFEMSSSKCMEYATRFCFEGTYNDRQSGGPICVYEVQKDQWERKKVLDILDLYWELYDEKLSNRTLFLMIRIKTAENYPMIGDDLRGYFSKELEGSPKLLHRVCQILLNREERAGCNFHRLVFDSEEEAKKVLECAEKRAVAWSFGVSLEKIRRRDCFRKFHKVPFMNEYFYLAEASKSLVEEMRNIREELELHQAYGDIVE